MKSISYQPMKSGGLLHVDGRRIYITSFLNTNQSKLENKNGQEIPLALLQACQRDFLLAAGIEPIRGQRYQDIIPPDIEFAQSKVRRRACKRASPPVSERKVEVQTIDPLVPRSRDGRSRDVRVPLLLSNVQFREPIAPGRLDLGTNGHVDHDLTMAAATAACALLNIAPALTPLKVLFSRVMNHRDKSSYYNETYKYLCRKLEARRASTNPKEVNEAKENT